MANNLYFCNVKSQLRHMAAAIKQRFLCPANSKSIAASTGVSDNDPEAFAVVSLTSRNAAFLFNVKLQLL